MPVEAEGAQQELDPRIVRTRQLLQESLCILLKKKAFDEITVQDIADAATVNRATFYDHYADKFSLLGCMVANRFHQMLVERQVEFDGTCLTAMSPLVLALCDYLAALQGPAGDRRVEPHMETAILGVLRTAFSTALKEHPRQDGVPQEMAAAAAAWALYGAAREWVQSKHRVPSEQIVASIVGLVSPVLHGAAAVHP